MNESKTRRQPAYIVKHTLLSAVGETKAREGRKNRKQKAEVYFRVVKHVRKDREANETQLGRAPKLLFWFYFYIHFTYFPESRIYIRE